MSQKEIFPPLEIITAMEAKAKAKNLIPFGEQYIYLLKKEIYDEIRKNTGLYYVEVRRKISYEANKDWDEQYKILKKLVKKEFVLRGYRVDIDCWSHPQISNYLDYTIVFTIYWAEPNIDIFKQIIEFEKNSESSMIIKLPKSSFISGFLLMCNDLSDIYDEQCSMNAEETENEYIFKFSINKDIPPLSLTLEHIKKH